jgi:hypothetical protein
MKKENDEINNNLRQLQIFNIKSLFYASFYSFIYTTNLQILQKPIFPIFILPFVLFSHIQFPNKHV